jgi:glycosyltransferase involved in cell wall biosynthesis
VTFAIASNGFAEGPAQALRDYLVSRGARVVTIFHPLTAEQGRRHLITSYEHGDRVHERGVLLPLSPPLSYTLDPFVPVLPPRVDAWFGFNPLACARGLVARGHGRARFVAHWSVDFVPDRFGRGTIATRIYDRLDRLCCLRADARVELSEAAREARNARHGFTADHTHVVPMGAWIDRVPTTSPEGFERRRVVFLGHLVERQGVHILLEALTRLPDVSADIVGGGELEPNLRARAMNFGLGDRVVFHGYVEDHRKVERILAGCSIAAAPYAQRERSFTRYADPGKLKAYAAAGLPIVLTNVPPNAREFEREAGAEIVADDPSALADAISRGLAAEREWRARRASALRYARRFDWNTLLTNLLEKLGLNP